VYVPAHFTPTEADIIDLLTNRDAPGSREGIGAFGALCGHVTRKNDQWREPATDARYP
jgi:predicted FMN-binding regulatory protein PaiB